MHSSRMRTVRYSSRRLGGRCLPGGVSASGPRGEGCLPLSRGVSTLIVSTSSPGLVSASCPGGVSTWIVSTSSPGLVSASCPGGCVCPVGYLWSWGGCLPGGSLPLVPGDVCQEDVCLWSWGVSVRGMSASGPGGVCLLVLRGVSQHALGQTLPPREQDD